jgi:hypothetical protein
VQLVLGVVVSEKWAFDKTMEPAGAADYLK